MCHQNTIPYLVLVKLPATACNKLNTSLNSIQCHGEKVCRVILSHSFSSLQHSYSVTTSYTRKEGENRVRQLEDRVGHLPLRSAMAGDGVPGRPEMSRLLAAPDAAARTLRSSPGRSPVNSNQQPPSRASRRAPSADRSATSSGGRQGN